MALTASGQTALNAFDALVLEANEELLKPLDAPARQQLLDLLDRLLAPVYGP